MLNHAFITHLHQNKKTSALRPVIVVVVAPIQDVKYLLPVISKRIPQHKSPTLMLFN